MTHEQRQRSRLAKLHKLDCRCYWCHKPTRLLQLTGGRAPDDMATTEHLDSRLSANRGKMAEHGPRTVLACYKCNHTRGKLEVAILSDEERWQRSGCYPRGHRLRKWQRPRAHIRAPRGQPRDNRLWWVGIWDAELMELLVFCTESTDRLYAHAVADAFEEFVWAQDARKGIVYGETPYPELCGE